MQSINSLLALHEAMPEHLRETQPLRYALPHLLLATNRQPLTRTRSLIIAGQRVEFAFATGGRALRRHGMPMYALANASEEELCKNMTGGRDQIGAVWQLRRIRVRFEVRRAAPSGCRWR